MKCLRVVSPLLLVILVSIGAMAAGNDEPKYNPTQKEFYLNQSDLAFLQPGLTIKIQSVEVNGTTVSATFKISDEEGRGLDMDGVETPGSVTPRWILALIKPGDTQYTAYTVHTVTSNINGNSAVQPTTDSGGSYESLGNGVYKYTFGTQLPSGDPADATHTVGVYATRNLTSIAEELGLYDFAKNANYVSNDTSNFLPSGGEPTVVRDVVATSACNQCHDPLALHGGSRRETRLCILCHQPQNSDPDTGNTVDFKVMIHKIHMGAFLPSVTGSDLNILATSGSGTSTTATGSTPAPRPEGYVPAGTPYQIIGYRDSVHDYSTTVWPQDVRNCTTCHQGGSQSDNYKTNPNRAACGSCHDNVNFATGEHHGGGIQTDDSQCSICHPADGPEFSLSVTGIHTIPTESTQLPGIKLEILGVTNTNPGDHPTVDFKITDKDGNPVDIAKMDRVRFRLAGPTTDYTYEGGSETATTASVGTPSGYSYTFTGTIPEDASGTYAIGGEAREVLTIGGSIVGQSFPVRHQAFNPIFYFSVDGSAVHDRRTVVDVNKCNVCHKKLALHGASRTNTQYCVMCHNPKLVDDGLPVNFRTHIHRIHRGEELETEWTFGSHNFNGVLFPGDLRDCAKCHVNDSYELPLPEGLANTDSPGLFYTPLGPAASACLGCHDGEDAAAHAFLQTAVFPSGKMSESCPVCHEEGADFAVSRIHAH